MSESFFKTNKYINELRDYILDTDPLKEFINRLSSDKEKKKVKKYITKEMCIEAIELNPKLLTNVPNSLIDIELGNLSMNKIQDKKYFSDNIFMMDKFRNNPMKYDLSRILNIITILNP